MFLVKILFRNKISKLKEINKELIRVKIIKDKYNT